MTTHHNPTCTCRSSVKLNDTQRGIQIHAVVSARHVDFYSPNADRFRFSVRTVRRAAQSAFDGQPLQVYNDQRTDVLLLSTALFQLKSAFGEEYSVEHTLSSTPEFVSQLLEAINARCEALAPAASELIAA